MPIQQRMNLDNETDILIWHIDESLQTLQKPLELPKKEQQRLVKKKSSSHKKQFLASRNLLLQTGIPLSTLSYDLHGTPQLESGQHLSISHSKDIAGIAIGNKPLGFDLEAYRPKILNIAPRFLNTKEGFALKGSRSIEKLTLIWTAKEALYKALKRKGIIFSKQLLVAPFQWGDHHGSAKVLFSDNTLDFSLNFIIEKDYCATLATQKNKI